MHQHQFNFDPEKGELLITLKDAKFDASEVGHFKAALEKTWDEAVAQVVIDFSKVDFIDSSGVGALLNVKKRLKKRDGPVIILNAGSGVVNVIRLLRLHRVFTLQKTGAKIPL